MGGGAGAPRGKRVRLRPASSRPVASTGRARGVPGSGAVARHEAGVARDDRDGGQPPRNVVARSSRPPASEHKVDGEALLASSVRRPPHVDVSHSGAKRRPRRPIWTPTTFTVVRSRFWGGRRWAVGIESRDKVVEAARAADRREGEARRSSACSPTPAALRVCRPNHEPERGRGGGLAVAVAAGRAEGAAAGRHRGS